MEFSKIYSFGLTEVKLSFKPIWRESNDVLDVSSICSPVEGKSDDEDNDADHFKVGGRNEGHEDHAESRYQKS